MEAGFLNFHDEEHFSDFSLLDQHDSLEESQNSHIGIIDSDIDYVLYTNSSHIDAPRSYWEDEQELNGDMAVLPVSGVASVIPKIENFPKEDYAKTLTDWNDHLGFHLGASDMEDHYMAPFAMTLPEKMQTDSSEYNFPNELVYSPPPIKKEPRVKKEPVSPTVKKKLIYSNVTETMLGSDNASFDLLSLATNDSNTITELPKLLSSPGKLFDATSPIKNKKMIKVKVEPATFTNTIPIVSQNKLDMGNIKMEYEDCIDIETVPEHVPVLEAGDVKSLLEQFEASEATLKPEPEKKSSKNLRVVMKKRPTIDQSKQTLLKKSVDPKSSALHQNIRDSLPKEVVDRIKASARSKTISVIPALSNPSRGNRSNASKIHEPTPTPTPLVTKKKITKILPSKTNFDKKMKESVQLDHDYCSSAVRSSKNSAKSSDKQNGTKKQSNNVTSNVNTVGRSTLHKEIVKRGDKWIDNNSKKDSGLESGDVSDASEEHATINNLKLSVKERTNAQNNSKQIEIQNNRNNVVNTTKTTKAPPVYEMKIRSALATSILQLRKGVLTKTKPVDSANGGVHKGKLVSVLKKPPVSSTNQLLPSNPNESIITTKNSSNDEVQNIIVQNVEQTTMQNEVENKPAKKRLNLAEYRSRRELTRSDSSRTCSPIQPMTLVYVHHASTTTEPNKDDPENLVWSEREIVPVLKTNAELEEDKNRTKPTVCSIAIQTNDETVIDCTPTRVSEKTDKVSTEAQSNALNDKKERNYRQRKLSTSPNRSRSRTDKRSVRSRARRRRTRSSTSRSSSRSKSRSSRNRLRSRSQSRPRSRSRSRSRSRLHRRSRSQSRRRDRRRRTISHRRSSYSSDSSWSSRSRSRSSFRSRSSRRRSRSRSTSRSSSRSSRSRSRSSRYSRSSSRYSSGSRSSSNLRRKWPRGRGQKGRRESRTRYDRHRRCSSGSSYGSRYNRRSSLNYRRPFDGNYNQEKKRQVEERRVIYVGRLEEGITKAELRRRFEEFGPVVDISVHFREHGDNYGFVTFLYKDDAYQAVEHGNDDISLPRYDLCFGGRRAFCKVKYADLDGMASSSSLEGGGGGGGSRAREGEFSSNRSLLKTTEDNTFDLLLKEAKAKLRKRKV